MGQVSDWSLAARQRLQTAGGPVGGGVVDERCQLLDAGEQLLSQGDVQAARQAFDRAAMMLHAADTEAALVRTHMQAGEYRQALAFGARAAGAHRREWPAGTALYAWLLQVGGQGVVAQRMLDEAPVLAPDDAALLAAQAQLARPWPQASGPLALPLQVAPYAVGAAVPPGARVVGSALLLASGTAALAPAALLRTAALRPDQVWLRNGLGDTVAAQVEQPDEALGLVLLRLAAPLPAVAMMPVVHDPFAGAPASMVEFGTADGALAAAWPLLRQGFFSRVTAADGPRLLGIAAPAGPRGGPVFDAAGRLAGIAIAAADGQDRLVPASALLLHFGPAWIGNTTRSSGVVATGPARAEVDVVYERALRSVLQVLLAR